MKFKYGFAFFVFDALYIVIFWSLHALFMAFTSALCWFSGDCPNPMKAFFSNYHLIDILVTSLILYITVRIVKAIIESIAAGEGDVND